MKKVLILFVICFMSCGVPQYSSFYYPDTYYPNTYYPNVYYQPTKVIVIKNNKKVYKKRNVKVKINKRRKIKKR